MRTPADCQRYLLIGRARIPEHRAYAAADHRVRITGIFQYRKFETRVIDPGSPGHRGIEQHTMGFGWGGIFEMQITNISDFEVLK